MSKWLYNCLYKTSRGAAAWAFWVASWGWGGSLRALFKVCVHYTDFLSHFKIERFEKLTMDGSVYCRHTCSTWHDTYRSLRCLTRLRDTCPMETFLPRYFRNQSHTALTDNHRHWSYYSKTSPVIAPIICTTETYTTTINISLKSGIVQWWRGSLRTPLKNTILPHNTTTHGRTEVEIEIIDSVE
jgi:hypothetical protein